MKPYRIFYDKAGNVTFQSVLLIYFGHDEQASASSSTLSCESVDYKDLKVEVNVFVPRK